MDRIGSKEEEESAMLPLLAGLPSDWSGLLRLEKNYAEYSKSIAETNTCFLPCGTRFFRDNLWVKLSPSKKYVMNSNKSWVYRILLAFDRNPLGRPEVAHEIFSLSSISSSLGD